MADSTLDDVLKTEAKQLGEDAHALFKRAAKLAALDRVRGAMVVELVRALMNEIEQSFLKERGN